MKKYLLPLFLLAVLASCASIPGKRPGGDGVLEQLRAENRMMKRNSELALRENEVLKTENARYRSETHNMKRKLERLTNDIDALNVKYMEDMTRANETANLLEQQLLSFKQESDELKARSAALQEEAEAKDRTIASLEKAGEENRNRITLLETSVGKLETLIRQREAELQETMRQLQQAQKELAGPAEGEAGTDHFSENPDGR